MDTPGYNHEKKKALVQLVLAGKVKSTRDLIKHGLMTEEGYQAYVGRLVDSIKPQETDPRFANVFIALGSGPASGKSTIKHLLFNQTDLRKCSIQLGADHIRAFSPEYSVLRNLKDNDPELVAELDLSPQQLQHLRSICYDYFILPEQRIFEERVLKQYGKSGTPIIYESHMDDIETTKYVTNLAKQQGYQSLLLSPDVDIPTFFERGTARVQQTGKLLPMEKSLTHHKLFEANWPETMGLFDVACRLDNNGPTPSLIAVAVDGQLTIHDEAAYDRARQKLRINPKETTPEKILSYNKRDECDFQGSSRGMEEGTGASPGRGFRDRVNPVLTDIIQKITGPHIR